MTIFFGASVNRQPREEWERRYFELCRTGTAAEVEPFLNTHLRALNLATDKGYTGLMYAIFNGKQDIIDLFLAHRTNLNIYNSEGHSAMAIAVSMDDISTLRKLVEQGARIEPWMNKAASAFTIAIQSGRKDMAEYLLANGADINHQDRAGWTPLMYAVSNGHSDHAEFLLQHRAMLDLVNEDKRDALAMAELYSRTWMVELLKKEPQRRAAEDAEHRTQMMRTGIQVPVVAQRLVLKKPRQGESVKT